jgi:sigma-B regulation protein RsbU (phosphoserine phosphatase)
MSLGLIKTILFFLSGGFLLFLAITIARDNFANRLNRVAGFMLFMAGLGPLALALGGFITSVVSPPTAHDSALYNMYVVWEFFFPAFILFALLFPTDRVREISRGRVIYLIFLPQILHLIILLFYSQISGALDALSAGSTDEGFVGLMLKPFAFLLSRVMLLLGFSRTYEFAIFGTVNALYILAGVYFLESGARVVNNPRLAAQTKAVLMAVRVGLGLYVASLIVKAIWSGPTADVVAAVTVTGASVLGAGLVAYAVIRHQFLDVRTVLRQTMIFTFASAALVALYIMLAMRSREWLTPVFGDSAEVVNYVFILILLLLFQPMSTAMDNVIRSMFMRTRSDHRNIIERFSRQVISQFNAAELRKTIEETFKTALLVERVYFVLFDDTVTEYAILQSEDYPKRTVLDRGDLMLRGINLLDSPTVYGALSDYRQDSELAGILESHDVRMILPMKDAKNLLGFVALTGKVAGYRYSPEDYNLLGVLSNQMVTALTNSRLYADSLERTRLQEEVTMARQIQVDLLPDTPPRLAKFSIAAQSTPSRTVGGDFYDFIPINEDKRLGIVIADASGKGMPAALLIAQIQAIIRCEVGNGNPISTIMRNMNRLVCQSTSLEKYVTLFYGELELETGLFHYSNAGHNYPILARSNGSVELLETGGPIIGAFAHLEYQSASVQLQPDDALFFYTDGLSEAMNTEGQEFGDVRIRGQVSGNRHRHSNDLMNHVLASVREFDPTSPPQDDTTTIAIKMTSGNNNHE